MSSAGHHGMSRMDLVATQRNTTPASGDSYARCVCNRLLFFV